jgi:Fe-S-cluster containining protein
MNDHSHVPGASPPVFALNLHAGFACRHSGACCTAGWPIPVEGDVSAAIAAHMPAADAILHTAGPLPAGAAAVIAPPDGGACPFFMADQGRLCAIQRRLGHESLPLSCRQFPRVALLEADAVRVTLSHFCPTAAWMLFAPGPERLVVTADAAGIADCRVHDGFDARTTIPPLLRPGVAMDAETCRLWETHLLRILGSPAGLTPEDALARAAIAADMIRDWPAEQGSLESHAAGVLADGLVMPYGCWTMSLASAVRLFRLAAGSVPQGLASPEVPADPQVADAAWVRPRWDHDARPFANPIGRYLAARSFGAWSAYLGEGLRTQVAMLAVALAAVRIEAVREAARAQRPLDDTLLHAAIRSADLLLHHLSDAAVLVRSLAPVEQGARSSSLALMGLEEAQ